MTLYLQSRDLSLDQVHDLFDRIEGDMSTLPQVECPLEHLFTPGLYTRQITMPAGSMVSSKIHKTRHQFIISKGKVSVYNILTREVVTLQAPYRGITEPGTRRFLFNHTEVVWTTIHPTEETDLDKIEAAIIEPHANPFLLQ